MKFRFLLLPGLAVGMIACGGPGGNDNSEAAKSASQIVDDAASCLRNTQSVHFKGDVTQTQQHVVFDLDATRGSNAAGPMTLNGGSLDLVVLDGVVYFKGGSDFWNQFGGASAAALLADKWVKLPSGTGVTQALNGISMVTDFSGLADSLEKDRSSAVNKGAVNTPDNRPAVKISSPSGGDLFVSTAGNPCPIYVLPTSNGSQGSGYIALSRFDQAVSITAPPGALDLSALATPTP